MLYWRIPGGFYEGTVVILSASDKYESMANG